ncbi:MAG TPA: CopD family protein [Herpetosiphonaceae bacterium]
MRHHRGTWMALALAVIALLAMRGAASAHANLLRSTPAAGETLKAAPAEIVLEFSEELDTSFTKIELRDSANQIVAPGPGVVSAANPRELRLALSGLVQDSYTAIWRVRSAVDGHVTEGSLPFGIGVAVSGAALIPPLGTPEPATALPRADNSLLRWLLLLGSALAVGGFPFALYAARPLRDQSDPATLATLAAAVRRQTLAGAALSFVAGALFLVSQAATAAGVSWGAALGSPLLELLGGRTGVFIAIRIICALALGALVLRAPADPGGWVRRWQLALPISALLLLTWSLTGHGAALASGRVPAIAADWIHLAATGAWIGGFMPLLALIRHQRANGDLPLADVVRRFSRLAIGCVALLTLTGAYASLVHIGGLEVLTATTYGRALLAKLAIFGGLLLAGALQVLVFSPRLRRGAQGSPEAAGGRMGLVVRGEIVGAALVLAAAGLMTSVAPGKDAWAAQGRLGVVQTANVDGVEMVLRIAPGGLGDNEFAVDVTDSRPAAAAAADSKVLLRLTMTEMEMGQVELEGKQTEPNRYTARGNVISMSGTWNIEVIVRKTGFNDVRHTFPQAFTRRTDPNAVASQPTPIAPEAIARGQALFAINCTPCHGARGWGDGPAGATLRPKPADLRAPHLEDHDDAQIAEWIRTGFPGSAMPGFGGRLSEAEIGDLVAFVRSVRIEAVKDGTAPTRVPTVTP